MLSYAIGGFLSGMIGDRMRMSTVIAGGLAGSALCVLLLAGGAADHLLQKTVRLAGRQQSLQPLDRPICAALKWCRKAPNARLSR